MTKKLPRRVVAAVLFMAAAFANSANQASAANDAASPQSAPDRALVARPTAAASLGSTEKNWLVAIGVNQFKDKSVQTLRFCVADAQALYDFFTSTGFVPQPQAYLLVTGADDPDRVPTRVNILAAIKYVASRAGEDSTVIVHFSGHVFDDAKSASYLLPEDGKRSLLEDTAVSVARVNELLAGAKTKRKILIVDACRSETGGSVATDGRGGETAAASEAFIQALRASSGQVTMASCGKGEIAYEMPESGHGAYTHFLLAGLKGAAEANAAGLITLSSLQDYVARAVPGWCSQQMKEKIQQPWMSGEMSLPIPLAVKLGVPPSGGPFTPKPPESGTPNKPPSELDAIDAYGKAETIDGNNEYTAKRKADAWRVYLDKYRATGYQVAQAQERQTYWQNWRPPVTSKPKGFYYTVKKGDTIESIAQAKGVSAAAIRAANRIPDVRDPSEGSSIFVPAPLQEIASSGRFTVASNGVITDWQQNLDWYVGPDNDTGYDAAVSWVKSLSVDGGGWRMPTKEELKTLYEKGLGDRNMNPVFKTTGGWVWAEEHDSSSAWGFNFNSGTEGWSGRNNSYYDRVFAARSRR